MPTLKRTFSVLLCCVLFAAFAPMACAEDNLIDKASATFTVPADGEPFDFDAITVPDGAHYTAKILDAYYYSGSYQHIKSGDTVMKGIRYAVRVRFYADAGYRLLDSETEYTVNGDVTKSIVGTNLVEVSMYPADKTPDDPAPVKLTFRQRIVQFFRSIRLGIQNLFRMIRHLFGLV